MLRVISYLALISAMLFAGQSEGQTPSNGSGAQPETLTRCDEVAGDPFLPRVPGAVGRYRIEPTEIAARICADDSRQSDDPLLAVLHARALHAHMPTDPQIVLILGGLMEAIPAIAGGWLGQIYEDGYSTSSAGPAQARSYYEAACALDDGRNSARACTGLALMMIEGRGGDETPSAGFELLTAQCSADWPPACLHLALQSGLRGTDDPARVPVLLDRACEGGELYACSALGFRYEIGEDVEPDVARAMALYERACEGREPEGCGSLGHAYRVGLTGVPDPAEAARYLRLGCAGDDPFSCRSLAEMLEHGEGGDRDLAHARALYERACAWGDPEACDMYDALR